MTDDDKPIKPLHGKLVTVIENKELYEQCVSREKQYEEWSMSIVEGHLREDKNRYCNDRKTRTETTKGKKK